MTHSLKSCESLDQLHGLVEEHAKRFNLVHFKVAVRKLSQLIMPGDDAWHEEDWFPLFNRAVVLAPTWSAEDISNLTYDVSVFEGGAAASFKGALQRRAVQIVDFSQKQIAKCLYGLAFFPAEVIIPEIINAMARRVDTMEFATQDHYYWGLQVRPPLPDRGC